MCPGPPARGKKRRPVHADPGHLRGTTAAHRTAPAAPKQPPRPSPVLRYSSAGLVTLRLRLPLDDKTIYADSKVSPAGKIVAMSDAKPHLRTLEEIERTCVPGLVEVMRTEGTDGVRYALWDMTAWHRDYSPAAWRSRATEEQKRVGWESWVRMEKIIATVLHEAYERQVEEAMDALAEGPDGFYGSSADRD